jgi:hypothetical protein
VDRLRYRLAICDLLQSAGTVPFSRVTFRDGTSPKRNKCHQNVEQFVSENPDYKPVRGWISVCEPIRDAHSIVRAPTGECFDITPIEPESCRAMTRFAEHKGDEEAFVLERRFQEQFHCTCPRHPQIEMISTPSAAFLDNDPWDSEIAPDFPGQEPGIG